MVIILIDIYYIGIDFVFQIYPTGSLASIAVFPFLHLLLLNELDSLSTEQENTNNEVFTIEDKGVFHVIITVQGAKPFRLLILTSYGASGYARCSTAQRI